LIFEALEKFQVKSKSEKGCLGIVLLRSGVEGVEVVLVLMVLMVLLVLVVLVASSACDIRCGRIILYIIVGSKQPSK
jgi:hypothetical protein